MTSLMAPVAPMKPRPNPVNACAIEQSIFTTGQMQKSLTASHVQDEHAISAFIWAGSALRLFNFAFKTGQPIGDMLPCFTLGK
jgi:hypothetical protein